MYAGATILGDGTVVLILDASTLARRANVLSHAASASRPSRPAPALEPSTRCSWWRSAAGRRAAIPLEMVTRLEEIPAVLDRTRRRPRGGPVPRPHHAADPDRRACSASYGEDDGDGRAARGLHPRRAQRRLRGRADPRHRHRARRHPQRHRRPGSRRQRRRRRQGRRAARRATARSWPPTPTSTAATARTAVRRCRGGPRVSQLSTFRVGKYLFGVDVSLVQEVVRLQQMTPVPARPGGDRRPDQPARRGAHRDRPACHGSGCRPRDSGREPVNVVVRMDDEPVSLLVDEIGGVLEVSQVPFEHDSEHGRRAGARPAPRRLHAARPAAPRAQRAPRPRRRRRHPRRHPRRLTLTVP